MNAVRFWSETCGFCTLMMPVFELLAKQYGDRAHFRTVDVMANPELGNAFQIMGLPAFKVLLKGNVFMQVASGGAAGWGGQSVR